jgi:hypothetical protein
MGRYVSTITYDHNENLSCVTRNFLSSDSCVLRGYNLQIKIVFETWDLNTDLTNIPLSVDRDIKNFLLDTFHFTTIVGANDPHLPEFDRLSNLGIIKLKIIADVGLEKFAEHIFFWIQKYITENNLSRLIIKTVEVREHSGRSSLYIE